MIIGNGNIAKILIDREGFIFFASGVSDSSCVDESEYDREKNLLMSCDTNSHLVYFSNLAVYDRINRYILHKVEMENIIKKRFQYYTIIRMEVCTWVNNPTTILNVFKEKLKISQNIEIRDEYRYLVGLNEFRYWVDKIVYLRSGEINITGTKMSIKDIVGNIKAGLL